MDLRASLRLLLSRKYGTFWFASLLSNIGTWAQQVAQPWLLLSLGASPFLLGPDSFALGAPGIALTLVGGALADRSDRRRTIVLFQSIQMWCPVVLVVLLMPGAVQPWEVIALSLVIGVTDALSMPSFQSIVPSMVARDDIPRAMALNATQFNLSRMLGPAIAGVLMSGMGAQGAFAVSAASYLPFLAVALWVLPKGDKRDGTPTAPLNAHQLAASVRQVVVLPLLRGALLTVLTTSLLSAQLVTFCPLLLKEALHGDVSHFSTAMAAFGVGGLLGAAALLAVPDQADRRPLASLSALLHAATVALAALSPWPWALPLLLAAAGLAMTTSNTSANALLQLSAPAHLRGQTVSLYMLAMRGGMALGGLLTGWSAHVLGVRDALLINGALALLAHAVVALWWRRAARPRPQA